MKPAERKKAAKQLINKAYFKDDADCENFKSDFLEK